jgi:hypothetical protein
LFIFAFLVCDRDRGSEASRNAFGPCADHACIYRANTEWPEKRIGFNALPGSPRLGDLRIAVNVKRSDTI